MGECVFCETIDSASTVDSETAAGGDDFGVLPRDFLSEVGDDLVGDGD